MTNAEPGDRQEPPQAWEPSRVRAGSRRSAIAVAALGGVALVVAIAFAILTPPDQGGTPLAAAASAPASDAVDGSGSAEPSTPTPTTTPVAEPSGPPIPWVPGPPGRIAYVGPGGLVNVVDDETGDTVHVPFDGPVTLPPAWSPDGSQLAVIAATGATSGLSVAAVPVAGAVPAPTTLYESADKAPFYLYWAPDGQRVGFLASDVNGITLRTAPADGSRPTDGPAHDGVLRLGAPLYFTWEDAGRLLLHVGSGASAFAGEIGLDGATSGAVVPGTGDFRPAAVSADRTEVAYVRGGTSPEIVVERRDGTNRRRLQVYGPAAMAFDPTGTMLATLAADAPPTSPAAFPLGALRLLDPASGDTRTLLDTAVVAFYWSPDGRTIAALRLAPAAGASDAAVPGPVALASTVAAPVASPAPAVEVHLTFVDRATGDTRSDRVVTLGDDFVSTMLPYFDQYALSHRVWSPGSEAIVLPLKDSNGRTLATVLDAAGGDPRPIAEAVSAFWAP